VVYKISCSQLAIFLSFPFLFPHGTPLSLITSCTPTKSNLYLANSLASAVSDSDPYRLLTFHVPNLRSLSRCVDRTNVSVQVRSTCLFRNYESFYGKELLTPRPTPNLEDHTLSAVRDCLYNTFAAIPHTGFHLQLEYAPCRGVMTITHLLCT
jgi:hypothetical protein